MSQPWLAEIRHHASVHMALINLSRAPSPCHCILRRHGAVTHCKMHLAANVSDDPTTCEEPDVQSHMFRPTITDMQPKSTVAKFMNAQCNSLFHMRPFIAFKHNQQHYGYIHSNAGQFTSSFETVGYLTDKQLRDRWCHTLTDHITQSIIEYVY